MATKVPINDPMIDPRTGEYAVIAPGHNFKSVTQKIAGIVLTSNTPLGWFFGLIVAGGVATGVVIGLTWLFLKGVGIWGVTMPGAWGFAIINFVWWIGIGHAGTLIWEFRQSVFYFSDDGDVMAVRVGDYKFNLAVQRCPYDGTLGGTVQEASSAAHNKPPSRSV